MNVSTDSDFGERLARIEGTVEQMDKRIDDLSTRVNERFDTLEERIDQQDEKIDREIDSLRTDIRRWLFLLATIVSVVVAVIQVLL
jgi:type VI protein secretion system component VasF